MLLFAFLSCRTGSLPETTADDSLSFYPQTPKELSKDEFRHYYRQITSMLDTVLYKQGFNGAVLICKKNAVIYESYKGLSDLRKADTLTARSSFHLASVSKTFTAMAILKLAERNQLSLHDSLQKFFPQLPYTGITVKMLLNHRSGIPNYLYFMSKMKWGKDKKGKWTHVYASNQDVLQVLATQKPALTQRPGSRFEYSNTNYVLLALIAEKVSEIPFKNFLENEIFDPLGMKDTYVFSLADTLTALPTFTASGMYWDYDFSDATYGDKNIFSTARDLLKWDQALYNNSFLKSALLDSAFHPYSAETPAPHNYGLGWRLILLPGGKKIMYHFGRWHGSNAAFARLPDEQAVIIILGNRFNSNIYRAAFDCIDILGSGHIKESVKDEANETGKTQPGSVKRKNSQ